LMVIITGILFVIINLATDIHRFRLIFFLFLLKFYNLRVTLSLFKKLQLTFLLFKNFLNMSKIIIIFIGIWIFFIKPIFLYWISFFNHLNEFIRNFLI
jgi:hypothetical protein